MFVALGEEIFTKPLVGQNYGGTLFKLYLLILVNLPPSYPTYANPAKQVLFKLNLKHAQKACMDDRFLHLLKEHTKPKGW